MPEPAPAPSGQAIAGHVKAVAILDLVVAALSAMTALALVLGLGIGATAVRNSVEDDAPQWVADMLVALAIVFGLLFAAGAALHAAAGLRLLDRRRSGKGLGIAAAVLLLVVSIPLSFGGIGLLGLAAAIYMLVILAREDTSAWLVQP